MNQPAKIVTLFSQPYLDRVNQCYKNIITINLMPQGPLAQLVRRIQTPPLSEFKQPAPCSHINDCVLALISLNNNNCQKNGSNLMVVDELPNLISFLFTNGYTIDTSLTKMFNTSDIRFQTENRNDLICFIKYTI
jgi:hypothetical protein